MRPRTIVRMIIASLLLAGLMLVILLMPLWTSVPAAAETTMLYDFEIDLEGWRIDRYSSTISRIQTSTVEAYRGMASMEMSVDMRDQNNYNSGQVVVTFATPRDLSGQTLTAWVYAPKGVRGHPSLANGIHLYAIDAAGRQLYGTWHHLWEDGWFQISLPITTTKPACGSIDSGFDPSQVGRIGINIAVPDRDGAGEDFMGPIYIDKISVGIPDTLASDHLYDFADPSSQTRIPNWDVDPPWGAEAWDELRVENETLIADSIFDTTGDSTRKGFMHIIYSPYVNLAHKDHAIVSLDVKFEPSAIGSPPNDHCPFVISLWAWDDYKQKWFVSDIQHVGAGDWTTISFDLENSAEFAPGTQDYEGDMPTLTDIRRIGVQLYANVNYTGMVKFDNIVVGGEEVPGQYESQNLDLVQTQGAQFMLSDEPLRFLGVNAEYLFTARESEVAAVLDAAQRLGKTAVRTWGFSSGCESDDDNCVAYSRYFQPARGKWNETAFENFDRVVAMAGERGLRLIIPLTNNWDEYGGIPQYMEWLAEEEPDQIIIPPDILPGTEAYTDTLHDLFFTNSFTRQWYQNYVTAFISRTNRITGIRYDNDPTIFSWEVINEARAKSDISGRAVHSWTMEMSNYIRSLDQNHLIGTGAEGWYIMPLTETQEFDAWQTFPKNYWHYGVNWKPDCDGAENWGSNGTDFLSTHSSVTRTVQWQESVGAECASSVQSEERDGLPNINYTSLHLYTAEGESNLYRAPYCNWGFVGELCDLHDHEYFQAQEWVHQHVDDSHSELEKPIIVAEFGLRKPEVYNGSPGTTIQYVPAYNPDDRNRMYQEYLRMMCREGVNGALIWNLGYDRFNDLFWDGVESLDHWSSSTGSLVLDSDPDTVSWGGKSLRFDYDPGQDYESVAIERVVFNEDWKSTYRGKIEIDLYNTASITQVAVGLVTGSSETRYVSKIFNIDSGLNTIVVNADLPYWQCAAAGCQDDSVVENLDDVRELSIVLYGDGGSGSVSIDYVRHQGNDSLVIYPDEPLFETIVSEAQRWSANCPRLFLPIISKFQGIVLDDFEHGPNNWFPALRNMSDWGSNEVATDVLRVPEAATGNWALKGGFNFGLTSDPNPRATYFRVINPPIQDWSQYSSLQFKAKSLVSSSHNVTVFIALATRDDSCWNELGDFQVLSSEYQTFTFDLDRPLYKTCIDDSDYDKALVGKDQVVRLHLILTAENQPSGAVLIDNIWLLK